MGSLSPVTVQIELHGYLKTGTAGSRMALTVSPSLHDALQEIRNQLPQVDARLRKGSVVILVNGVNLLRTGDTSVTLAEGDTITFVPFVAGG